MPWETDDDSNKPVLATFNQARQEPSSPMSSLGNNTLLLEAIDSEGGFIEDYIKDRARLSDTPHEFHTAGALSLLATAAGNRYSWQARGKLNHPNIHVVIVGPSGIRKSTAVNQAKGVLQEAIPDAVLPTSFSRESFDVALERRPDGILMFSEFSEFLRKAKKKDYLSGIIDHLTNTWDDPSKLPIKYIGRSFTIDNPAPNILGATTIDRLEEVIDIGDLRGGFLVRFLFVVAKNPGPEKALDATTWPVTSLTDALKEIVANKGEVDFKAVTLVIGAAEKQYKSGLRQSGRGQNPDLSGMYSRFETQVMKVATLFMLSRTHGKDLVITDGDILRASKLVTYSNYQMEDMPFSFTPTAKILKRLREMIDAKPGITQRDVLRAFGITKRELIILVSTIEAMEYTTTYKNIRGGVQAQYWPPGYVSEDVKR